METKDIKQTPQFKAFKAAVDRIFDNFLKSESERISDIINKTK